MTVTMKPIRAGEVLPERIDAATMTVTMAAQGLGTFRGEFRPPSGFRMSRPGGGGA